jgi:hypothetical protein
VLAGRPTTSRWTPPQGERSYQVRPILEGKNRGRHFVRKTPTPAVKRIRSQTSVQPSTLREPSPARGDQSEHRDCIRAGRVRRRRRARLRNATHRAVSSLPAGRVHRPDAAQAGPRRLPARAAAFIGREPARSPRKERSADVGCSACRTTTRWSGASRRVAETRARIPA